MAGMAAMSSRTQKNSVVPVAFAAPGAALFFFAVRLYLRSRLAGPGSPRQIELVLSGRR